jgi:hypothetical protein
MSEDLVEYCPLSREALVENARLRQLVGEGGTPEDETMLLKEVERLHAERDWALQELADVLDVPLADTRLMMRREFKNRAAIEDEKLTTEEGYKPSETWVKARA